jgi:hypothetical protein
MEKHTKIYYGYFDIDVHNPLRCEITGKYKRVDIHHIDARGMGGRPSADYIENLMGIWRIAHEFYGDKKRYKEFLRYAHDKFMETRVPLIEIEPDNIFIQEFLEYEDKYYRRSHNGTPKDDFRGLF